MEVMLPSASVQDFSEWYDNEWGYSSRCVDLAVFVGATLKNSEKQPPQKAAVKA